MLILTEVQRDDFLREIAETKRQLKMFADKSKRLSNNLFFQTHKKDPHLISTKPLKDLFEDTINVFEPFLTQSENNNLAFKGRLMCSPENEYSNPVSNENYENGLRGLAFVQLEVTGHVDALKKFKNNCFEKCAFMGRQQAEGLLYEVVSNLETVVTLIQQYALIVNPAQLEAKAEESSVARNSI